VSTLRRRELEEKSAELASTKEESISLMKQQEALVSKQEGLQPYS